MYLNVKQSMAEAILGLPPISISNKVNSIKHMLKLNIISQQNDPLQKLLKEQISNDNPCLLIGKMKETFQILEWKLSEFPSYFTEQESSVIRNKDYPNFSALSSKCCSYSKSQIKSFKKRTWQQSINSQFQLDGLIVLRLKRLCVPKQTICL